MATCVEYWMTCQDQWVTSFAWPMLSGVVKGEVGIISLVPSRFEIFRELTSRNGNFSKNPFDFLRPYRDQTLSTAHDQNLWESARDAVSRNSRKVLGWVRNLIFFFFTRNLISNDFKFRHVSMFKGYCCLLFFIWAHYSSPPKRRKNQLLLTSHDSLLPS